MLALSPSLFPSLGWPLELDPVSQDQQINNLYGECTENTTSESFLHGFPIPSEPQLFDQLDRSTTSSTAISSDLNMVKKLNHNASERDRRKKINHLYSSLRALLPATDHAKKLSIPATISHVLKYIPDLQQQVEGLVRKKEELLSMQKGNYVHHGDQEIKQVKTTSARSSLSSVSASQLNDREVAIQISTYKNPISEILNNLEDDGLSILNASSFVSFEGRVFHSLHLRVERHSMECEMLSEKLMSLFETRD